MTSNFCNKQSYRWTLLYSLQFALHHNCMAKIRISLWLKLVKGKYDSMRRRICKNENANSLCWLWLRFSFTRISSGSVKKRIPLNQANILVNIASNQIMRTNKKKKKTKWRQFKTLILRSKQYKLPDQRDSSFEFRTWCPKINNKRFYCEAWGRCQTVNEPYKILAIELRALLCSFSPFLPPLSLLPPCRSIALPFVGGGSRSLNRGYWLEPAGKAKFENRGFFSAGFWFPWLIHWANPTEILIRTILI